MNDALRLELIEKIRTNIEKIRPYLQTDGGDVIFVDLTDDMIVKVKLLGACGGCPLRETTLKQGVEATLKKIIPEIKSVEAV